MYLEHLVPSAFAILGAPRCFLRRLLHRKLVSFGLLANLASLKRRQLFTGVDGIIDVGANIGQFAYMAHSVWPLLPIYSFEPYQESFAQLEQTFKRYGIPGRCFPLAISDQGGEREFYAYDNSAINSFLKRFDRTENGAHSIEVRCVTLDELEEELVVMKNPMLKIDVQGYELSVLRGATHLLKRCKYVQIEASFQHEYEGNAHVADVMTIMRDNEFNCFDILDILRVPKNKGGGIREVDLLFAR